MNFANKLIAFGRSQPDQTAIILPDRMITWAMLASAIRSVSAAILEAGLRPGQIVGVCIENQIRHLVIVSALYRLGIISVSIAGTEPSLRAHKIDATITDRAGLPERFGRPVIAENGWFRADFVDDVPPAGFEDEDAPARIIWSSGTTGAPKAIVHSARIVEQRIDIGYETLKLKPWKRMMCLPSLTSSLGSGSALQALANGHSVVIAESAIDALRMIDLHGADLLVANPMHLRELLAVHRTENIPTASLKLIKFGGDVMSRTMLTEIAERFCPDILCVYSSTETGPLAFGHVSLIMQEPACVGRIAPWAQIDITGADGTSLAPGQIGRLRARTESQAQELGSESLEHGWNETGDIGHVTPDGRLMIHGRASNAISTRAGLVSAEEVEQMLLQIAGIKDAAAMADGNGGLDVALLADDDEAVAKARTRLASRFPDCVGKIRRVQAIPRNAMGKIIRQAVRTLLD